MKAIPILIGAVGFAALMAGSGYAAQPTARPMNNTTNSGVTTNDVTNNGTSNAATTNPNTGNQLDGSLQQSHGAWRASKLVGAGVYNRSGKNIAKVDDLLVNDRGQITTVVVSIGGFIGIGNKLVAVPFDKFRFERSDVHRTAAAGAVGVAPAGVHNGVNDAMNAAPAVTTANAGPPHYSLVLPNATQNSLNSAPSFNY